MYTIASIDTLYIFSKGSEPREGAINSVSVCVDGGGMSVRHER